MEHPSVYEKGIIMKTQVFGIKNKIPFHHDLALKYFEDVAPDEVLEVCQDEPQQGEDEILTALKVKLQSILEGTASNDEISSFIHCVECLSRSDVLEWAKDNGFTAWL